MSPSVESNKNHPSSPQRLTNRDLQVAEKELGETAKRRKQCLRELRQWIKNQPQLVNCRTDASFLLRFLRFQKYSLPETQTVIDKYVHMRTHHPEWFQNLDSKDPKMRELLSSGYLFVLPEKDECGRRVVFSRAAAMDASKFTACDIMRAHILTYETLLCDEENQINGLAYVFDEREINWSHISIWSPSEISKAFSCCERALPLRHQDIHFVHLPWTMNLVFQFAKSLLSQKLRERFRTHATFEKLSKTFPSHILPAEYPGGGNVPGEEMIESWIREMDQKREMVLALDEMRYGLSRKESLTSSTSNASTGVSGSGSNPVPMQRLDNGVLEVVGSLRKMENGKEN